MLRRGWERLEEGVIALLLAAMTLLTFIQVVLRYVFNEGLLWAVEATSYLFGWLILLGISYCVRVHAHIGIDLVVKALPRPVRRMAGLLAVGLCLLYAGVMAYGSYKYLDRLMILGVDAEDIPLQRWILTIILPIGFLLLGIRLLEQALAILRGEAAGFALSDEAEELLHNKGLTAGALPGGERRAPGDEPAGEGGERRP